MSRVNTKPQRYIPEPNTILEQLECDIDQLDKQPLPIRAAYFLVDEDLRIREYDQTVGALLGIPTCGSHHLRNCERLSVNQRSKLVRLTERLLMGDDQDEAYLRVELSRAGATEAFCFSLEPCVSAEGTREVVCKIEPILNSQPDTQSFPSKSLGTGLQLWSMDENARLFHMVSPIKGDVGTANESASMHLEEWIARVCEDDKDHFRENFERFMAGESSCFHMRYRFRKDWGELKWVSTIARRQHGPDEESDEIVGLHRDEAEIPNVLDDLRLFSYLAKKVHLAIVVTDPQGRITWCNNAFTEMTGYRIEEIVDKTPGSILQGPLSDDDAVRYMHDRLQRGKAFHAEIINYKKNGAPYWVRIDANPLVEEDGKVTRYIAFQTDITESKKTQNAILRNEIKFRSLFDNSLDGLMLVSPRDGIIIEANRAAVRFFGQDRVVGLKLDEIFTESDVFQIDNLRKMVAQNDGTHRETGEFIDKNGERRPVEMTVAETLIGDATSLFVTLRDISEKRALEEQLRHSQRMEAVGRLAGGIAHDFNNLLAGLRGFCELLCHSNDLTKRDQVYAEEVLKITDRASKLTSRLLSFSRGKSDKPLVVNLNDIVGNLTPMLSRILKKDIQFTSKLDPRLQNVRVDPAQIEQVIMNLVMNGQEAISGSDGKLTLNTRMVNLTGNEILITGKPRPGRYTSVSVRDNGHGMPSAVLEKIFEPFFTTKKGAGTGLGLSIVYGIIVSNGGHLMVDSHEGLGTEFCFYFPQVLEPTDVVETVDYSSKMPSVALDRGVIPNVLVAEDQDQVREILELGLGQSGYNLIVAVDGKQAIELARNFQGQIDLLLTDSIMPRASGCEVIREVRKLHQNVRVIMMSGLPQQESDDCRDLEVDAYVDKPFSIRKLLELIESLLGQVKR